MTDVIKFTPGPWRAVEACCGEPPYDWFISCPTGAVGYLPNPAKHGDGIQRYKAADARLIAAAPEMHGFLDHEQFRILLGMIEDGNDERLWAQARLVMAIRDDIKARAEGGAS